MAKINVKKPVYEDIRIGPGKLRFRSTVSKESSDKWSFFSKAGLAGWILKKASQKGNYASKSWDQKSIAKVSYMKNTYKGQWGVHGRYLARQGAQLEDMPGLGFDATDDDLNISKTLRAWQEQDDPRLWKIIISPEMAHKLDLKEHVRAIMGHVEKDLGTKLEWVAIDHYNTDNFHAHVVMRGVDKEGKELRINQEYFTKGFRQRSIQEATRALGLRLEKDVLLKREKNIKAMHVTEIDREIERRLTNDHFISLTPNSKTAFMNEKELQLRGRLMFLEEMGLAKKDSSVSWYVDPGFSDYLKFIQIQQDIVKTKNRHIKNILNPNLPIVVNKLENTGDRLIGRVVGMGLSDSRNEPRYMLIEGIDNKIHYVLATQGMTKKRDGGDLRNGEIIYFERREFFKEREHQEPERIRYVFAESFQSFSDIEQAKRLTNIDMVILGKFQEAQGVPKIHQCDGEVRKQFLEVMGQRIDLMRKINIIDKDFSINQQKLEWTLHNNLTLERGRSHGLGQGGF